MKQVKAMQSPVKPNAPRIKHLFGANRVLVIAPHGFKGNDDNTDILTEQLHERLDCFAVINTGFRRPNEDKRETSDPKIPLLDLGKINDGHHLRRPYEVMPHEEDFLGWIDLFLAEIAMNHGEPFVVYIHGIGRRNIREVASITDYKTKPNDLHALVGYGQRRAKTQQSLTANKKTVEDLIKNLAAQKINGIEAPVESIPINGKRYCGSEKGVLNQYLRNKGIKGQSIQLEIRESGFRDSPETARKTAESIGKAIGLVAGCASPAQKKEPMMRVAATALVAEPEVWTTLSEKSEEKRIKVKEIDLSDTRFKSRVSEYGVDQETFNDLVASIKSLKILNNIIVNKTPGKAKYQLISGFRRMAALEKVYEGQGRKEEFPTAEVPAKIFKSLTDEQALRISFSENLARKDLTTWEVANQCRMIGEELIKQGKSQGEIEAHLAAMINKDGRTVRRYLALSSIKSQGIRRDLHNGTIDASIGTVFTREGLKEKDRDALHRIYRNSPMPFRSFDALVSNALRLKGWSGMTVENIAAIPAAKEFLLIPPDELKERAEYLMKARNKPLPEILANEIGHLKHSIEKAKSKDALAPFTKKFSEKAAAIRTKISKALETKKMIGEVAISPVGEIKDKMIKLAVAAPVSDIQKVVQLALKEMNDDIASLESLFKKPPKPTTAKEEVKAEKKVKVDNNAAIAFTMRLITFQGILKDLAKDGVLSDDSKGQMLIRTASDKTLEFGRHCNNGLLIPCAAEIHRKGSSVLLLRDIYEPITKLTAKEDTECYIQIVPLPSKSYPVNQRQSTFALRAQEMTWEWDIPFFESNELNKYLDKKIKPKTTIDMEATDLKEMLSKVLSCINPTNIRRPWTRTLYRVDENKLTLAGTNGIKLLEVAKPYIGLSGLVQSVLVPFHAGSLLTRILRKGAGPVRIGISEEGVSFNWDGISLTGKPISDEQYPNYPAWFRKGESSFKIPISKLREMIANLSAIADPEDNYRLTVKTDGNHISIGNEKGKAVFYTDNADGIMDIDVNAMFLSELVGCMDGEEVRVSLCSLDKDSKIVTFHPDYSEQRALLVAVKRREPEKPREKAPENKNS